MNIFFFNQDIRKLAIFKKQTEKGNFTDRGEKLVDGDWVNWALMKRSTRIPLPSPVC
jgi:hypothetical protein